MVMSVLAGRRPGINLVCNGYKDREYMELVGAGTCALECAGLGAGVVFLCAKVVPLHRE